MAAILASLHMRTADDLFGGQPAHRSADCREYSVGEADHELGQFREKPERVDPLRLAINLANDFQPQAAEGGKNIIVDEITFSEVFDDKRLLVVKNLIAQALSNLLENAVKYSSLQTTI